MEKKFDPKKLKKLNDPDRLKDIPPHEIWEKLEMEGAGVLVDIGAGTGFFSIPFQKLTENGCVYACDISDTMVQWMQENICTNHPRIHPVKMEEARVPLQDKLADLVFMINLHHELEEPEKLLQESFRLLRDSGKIFIVDWKKKQMAQGPPLSIRVFPESVEQQLSGAGFRQIKTHEHWEKHFLMVGQK